MLINEESAFTVIYIVNPLFQQQLDRIEKQGTNGSSTTTAPPSLILPEQFKTQFATIDELYSLRDFLKDESAEESMVSFTFIDSLAVHLILLEVLFNPSAF